VLVVKLLTRVVKKHKKEENPQKNVGGKFGK
jgi:hypothetical protein